LEVVTQEEYMPFVGNESQNEGETTVAVLCGYKNKKGFFFPPVFSLEA
jgi:hypothetical protein